MNGYQSLINVWGDALGAQIKTQTKVTKIIWQNSDGTVTVQTENGEKFQADHVIITVSLGIFNLHFKNLSKSVLSIKISPVSKDMRIIEHIINNICLILPPNQKVKVLTFRLYLL